jgi:hypothetical protein
MPQHSDLVANLVLKEVSYSVFVLQLYLTVPFHSDVISVSSVWRYGNEANDQKDAHVER